MSPDGPHGAEDAVAGDPATTSLTPGLDATLAWAVQPVAPSPVPGVAGYVMLGELGRGGMGVVYQAHDTELNRVVAIKVLPGRGDADPLELARFRIEAETMASVSHPNVVTVHGVREAAGQPCLVMEYVNGGTLAAKLRRDGPLKPAEAARLVVAVARGVAAAHAQGVVHRDLKPSNVLLHLPPERESAPPQPKVADFGLARRGLSNEVTRTGTLLGTPAYMAPEQAAGKTKLVGPAVDVYGLGVILYECLAGAPPFAGDDHWSVLRQVIDAEPTPLRRTRPDTPRELELICGKCLAKDPRDRYASADAVADDLSHHLAGRPVSVRPVSTLEAGRKWARRNPALARMAGVVALAALTLAGFGVKYDADLRAAARRDRDAAQDLALSESKGRVLAAERQAADRAADDARRLAASQRFYRRLAVAEARRSEPTPGWTLATIADVAELAAAPEAAAEAGTLRDIAAAALAAPDVEECAPWLLPESGPFTFASRLVAHPTEPVVAAARFGFSGFDPQLTVWLVNWRTGATRTLHAPVWLSQVRLNASKETPDHLEFRPDGRRLYLVSRRGNVFWWDLDDPAGVATAEPTLAGVGPIAFRPDGRGFWRGVGKELRAYDAAGKLTASRDLGRVVASITPAAGAHRLVVATHDRVLSLDPDDLSARGAEAVTDSYLTRAAVGPHGRGGVVCANNVVSWEDFALGRVTGALDRGDDFPNDVIHDVKLSPDGALVAVPREKSHTVQLRSTLSGDLVATIRCPERSSYPPVAFSADGTRLFVGAQDRVRVFRLKPGAAAAALAVGPSPLHGVALDATGRALVTHAVAHLRLGPEAVAVTDSRLDAWDPREPAAAGRPLRSARAFGSHQAAYPPSLQPDGPWLATGTAERGDSWNLATGESRPHPWATHEAGVLAPGGRLWLSGGQPAAYRVADGHQFAAFNDTVDRYVSGASPHAVLVADADGVLLGAGSGALHWLSPEGVRRGNWKAEAATPSVAARRPGGDHVFVGHDSGAAAVYRLPAGRALTEWVPHQGRVAGAVWLGPDDLLTGGSDRRIHLWHFDGDRPTRVWSVRTAAGVRQMLPLPGGRVAVLEDNARGVGVLDVPRFHAEVAALVPTVPLRLTVSASQGELPPLPAALRADASPPPATGLWVEYFAHCPGTQEDVYVADGFAPTLPAPAAVPPHRDLPPQGFTARYRGYVQAATPGPYRLAVAATSEVSVWLDGKPVGPAVRGEGVLTLNLTGAPQRLRIEWRHAEGPAGLSLAWTSAGPVTLTPDRP